MRVNLFPSGAPGWIRSGKMKNLHLITERFDRLVKSNELLEGIVKFIDLESMSSGKPLIGDLEIIIQSLSLLA